MNSTGNTACEYYPFGLQTANSWTRENTTGNNFLGNGGTELNTTSSLYDLAFRNYDPVLGRMNGVDPMASKYASLTPYNYSFNDPVTFTDPSGADPEYGITRYTYDDRVDHYRGEFYSGGSTSALRHGYMGRESLINWSYAPNMGQLYSRSLAVNFVNGVASALASDFGGEVSLLSGGVSFFDESGSMLAGAAYKLQHGTFTAFNDLAVNLYFGTVESSAALGWPQVGVSDSDDLKDVTHKFYSQLAWTQVFYFNAKKEMDKMGASFEERLYYFAQTIGHRKLFDIKQPGMGFHYTEIGLRSKFNGKEYDWEDYGNMNFGLAARIFGISLNWAKFGAGWQQVFGDGDGPIDWGNLSGYFDQYKDTEMIKMGYYMKLPWQK